MKRKEGYNFQKSFNRNEENWNNTWGKVINGKIISVFAIFIIIGFIIVGIQATKTITMILFLILGITAGLYLFFGLGFRSVVITYINGYFYLIIYLFLTNMTTLYYLLGSMGIWLLSVVLYKTNKASREFVDFIAHSIAGFTFTLLFYELFGLNLLIINLLAISWGILFEIVQYLAFKYFNFPDLRYTIDNSWFDLKNNLFGQIMAMVILNIHEIFFL